MKAWEKLQIWVWLVPFLFPLTAGAEVRLGVEGRVEQRETGGLVYLPQGWVSISGSYLPSESRSIFGDLSVKGGWDTGMDQSPYDISGSLTGSVRGDPLFLGLEVGSRLFRTYETPRQWNGYVSSTLMYEGDTYSVFLKPGVLGVWGSSDSVTFQVEPGVEKLFPNGWIGTLSVRPAYTRYSGQSVEIALEPKLSLEWYPSVPFTASVSGGWSRLLSEDSKTLEESVYATLSFLWYPTLRTILSLESRLERVYRAQASSEKGTALDSTAELRVGLPWGRGAWDLIVGGGYAWQVQPSDPSAKNQWYLTVGTELKL